MSGIHAVGHDFGAPLRRDPDTFQLTCSAIDPETHHIKCLRCGASFSLEFVNEVGLRAVPCSPSKRDG